MTLMIIVFFLTRKCGQFSNDLVKYLTDEKRMKFNSSVNNNRTQIKVLEMKHYLKKSNNLGKYLNTNLKNPIHFRNIRYNYKYS